MPGTKKITRRDFLRTMFQVVAGGALLPLVPGAVWPREDTAPVSLPFLTKAIPSTGEKIPVIGMGTWLTFNIGDDEAVLRQRTDVLRRFFDMGGGLIDSSPMYGRAEKALGLCLGRLSYPPGLFSASKIWTVSEEEGKKQFRESQRLWGLKTFDLFQVHNLVNWPAHLNLLKELKEKGEVRYIGVTTSHGRRHRELENLMLIEDLDFIQVTYNLEDRAVEDRILPLARERGMAVIANRPFQGGLLIDRMKREPLPAWAEEIDCANWAQFLLKFIVSHPAVTVAIPATSRVDHMAENMGAAYGRLPGARLRKKMAALVR